MKKMSLIIAVAVLMIAIYAVGTAAAAKVTVVVKPGALTLTPSTDSNLLDATLTGDVVVTTGDLNSLEVREARGNNAGWNLTVQAADFEEINDPAKTITAGGFKVLAANGAGITGSGTVNPGAGVLSGSGISLLDSPNGSGYRGRYGATPSLQLTVPAATYVGTYAGTVTETLTSN